MEFKIPNNVSNILLKIINAIFKIQFDDFILVFIFTVNFFKSLFY